MHCCPRGGANISNIPQIISGLEVSMERWLYEKVCYRWVLGAVLNIANKIIGITVIFLFMQYPVFADEANNTGDDHWRIHSSASFVYLHRDEPPNAVIIQDTITGDTVLKGSDFNSDWAPGVDAMLGLSNATWGIEGRFFGGFNWDDSRNITTPVIWNFPTTPPLFGLGVANIETQHKSKLNSVAVNVLWNLNEQATFFGGIRWLDLTDRLLLHADFGANSATIRFDNDASGFGPQIGASFRAFEFASTNANLFLDLKGTLAAASLKHRADFDIVQSVGPAFGAKGRSRDWTLLSEFSANLGLHVSENVEMTLGYQLIYVKEAPSSTTQAPGIDILATTVNPSTRSLFAHGLNLGITMRY